MKNFYTINNFWRTSRRIADSPADKNRPCFLESSKLGAGYDAGNFFVISDLSVAAATSKIAVGHENFHRGGARAKTRGTHGHYEVSLLASATPDRQNRPEECVYVTLKAGKIVRAPGAVDFAVAQKFSLAEETRAAAAARAAITRRIARVVSLPSL